MLFSRTVYHFAVPPAMYDSSSFSTSLPTLFFSIFLIISILVGMENGISLCCCFCYMFYLFVQSAMLEIHTFFFQVKHALVLEFITKNCSLWLPIPSTSPSLDVTTFNQWFSTRALLPLQWTFVSVWRLVWLSQLSGREDCYKHLECRSQGCCSASCHAWTGPRQQSLI